MEEHFFEDKIYYRTNKFEPGRPTLVFIHGMIGSCSAWFPYEKIFENKYNILTFDIRGHGLSKKYSSYEDYEIIKFVEDLHDIVSYLHIPKFILISNSFGGLIHLLYIKLYGETVSANVFTSPEVYIGKTLLEKAIYPILSVLRRVTGFLPFNPKPRGHVDYNKHIGSTDWDIKRNFADIRNTGVRIHSYTLKQSFDTAQEYSLEKITVPTLIIHGQKDTFVPLKNSVLMSQKIKNCELVTIPDIDHNTVHNAVKEMSEAIESFLEKNNMLH